MPRTLYLSQRSPFARKVRILLLEKGLAFELKMIDLMKRSPEFSALSPLGKLPLLVDEDGTFVFDSTVMAEYLEDRYPSPALLGSGYAERLWHRTFDELGDTITEQAIHVFFDREHKPVVDKAKELLERALDEAAARIGKGGAPSSFGLGQASLLSALGYLEFRLGDDYTARRPALAAFIAPFLERESVKASPPPVA